MLYLIFKLSSHLDIVGLLIRQYLINKKYKKLNQHHDKQNKTNFKNWRSLFISTQV